MFAKTVCQLTIILACSLPGICQASLYSAPIRPMQFTPAEQDYSRGFDASIIQPVEPQNELSSADIQKIIPTNLDSSLSAETIAGRIVDQSLKAALASEALKKSSLGHTVGSVQKSLQTNVTVANREPNSIKHEFKIAMEPAQSQARLRYSGIGNASLTYRALESKTDFEMREPIHFISTDIVYNHIDTPSEKRDTMSLHWAW